LNTIKSEFGKLMELANRHDFTALHGMFWQSPSALLVAKSAVPSEGNWDVNRLQICLASTGGAELMRESTTSEP
jgi:hypothetical protein